MSKIRDTIQKNLEKVLDEIRSKPIQVEDNRPSYTWDDFARDNANEDFMNEEDDSNPYETGGWRGAKWFCIRCGGKLHQVPKDYPSHGAACWSDMRRNGTEYYQCDNEKCFHHSAPLLLHHPVQGINRPAGDSYSISWVK